MRRAAVLALLLIAGCGGVTKRQVTTTSSLAQAERVHEYPSPPPPQETAAGARNATTAVRAFADAYINWTYTTVAADLRRLAATSVGQARAAMTLAAAQTAGDYELQRGQVSNHGTVQAVAPLPGHPGQYVVVTEEATTAVASTAYQGLEPAWHVALATVIKESGGHYVVSAWEPQS